MYITHLRDVHPERGFGGGGVPEALEIGRRSGVKVHFSHYRTSPATAGRVGKRVELIDKAKAEGIDCTLELYPYAGGAGFAIRALPTSVQEGGPGSIMNALKDPSERAKLITYLEETRSDAIYRGLNQPGRRGQQAPGGHDLRRCGEATQLLYRGACVRPFGRGKPGPWAHRIAAR